MAVLSGALLSVEDANARSLTSVAPAPISSQFHCPHLGMFARLTKTAKLGSLAKKQLGNSNFFYKMLSNCKTVY